MIKKRLYNETLKAQLLAGARDRMHNFLLAGGAIRGVILNGTRMINEMRASHELGILETLVLGRAYLGTALMSADLKGMDRLSIQIDCSGPIKGLFAEANAFGEVRGFLKNVPIPIDKPMEDFNLSPFFEAGLLSVTKHLKDAKQPFTGKISLQHGNIAQDLARYYLTSEQIPTAFNLSIKFDTDGNVTGAGGMFLQAMPETDDDLAVDLEQRVKNLPSLGEVFTEDKNPVALVQDVFEKHAPRVLAHRRIEFMCHCNKDRLRSYIMLLPIEDLDDLRRNGPFPLEMCCQHCNTAFRFEKSDIDKIYGTRFPNN